MEEEEFIDLNNKLITYLDNNNAIKINNKSKIKKELIKLFKLCEERLK
jgi:hypothetical protein